MTRLTTTALVGIAGWLALSSSSYAEVQRRFTIYSQPPGAVVYVDNVQIGKTPVSHRFLHYGTRRIRLVAPGYETLDLLQPIQAPWYQLPGLDFFSDVVAPVEIRDERVLTYRMTPRRVVSTEQILRDGENLRRSAQPRPQFTPQPTPVSPQPTPIQPAPIQPTPQPIPQPRPGTPVPR